MISNPKVGDKVWYSQEFCQNAGLSYDMAQRTGIITQVIRPHPPEIGGRGYYVKVSWDDSLNGEKVGALTLNLERR